MPEAGWPLLFLLGALFLRGPRNQVETRERGGGRLERWMPRARALHLGSWARYIAGNRLAPFVQTHDDILPHLLKLASLKPGETILDLGCGNGAILTHAVHNFKAKAAVGYELDKQLVEQARKKANGDPRILVRHAAAQDSEQELRESDVVTLYLTTSGNASLAPLLTRALKPGARVVSHFWEIPGVVPTRTIHLVSGTPLHLFEKDAFEQTR